MLCEKIKEERLKHGYTQENVRTALGVSQALYSFWESGDKVPSIATLRLLADFYGVTTDYLLERDIANK